MIVAPMSPWPGACACSFQSTRAEAHQAPRSFSAYGPSIYTGHPTDNALEATVVAVERLGSESLLHARLSTEELVTWRAIGSDSSNPGDAVILGMDAARCHLFDGAGTAFTRLEASS